MLLKSLSITFLILSVLFTSCTDTGIFATIASSKKIERGTLPENINARKIFHISPAQNQITQNYYFLQAGTGIYSKDVSTSSKWSSAPLSLTTQNGGSWGGVQSAVAAGNRIFLVVYRYDGTNYSLGIQTLDSFNGSEPGYTFLGKIWENTSGEYQTINLFAPDPDGKVYVNVLSHNGKYASLTKEENNFVGSKLYTLKSDSLTWTGDESSFKQENISEHFITGIATHQTTNAIRISATKNRAKANSGVLLDGGGNVIETTGDLDKNTSLTGLTWIERSWSTTGGAFIAAATASIGGNYPIYASKDGTDWKKIAGDTPSYKISSFVDIGHTTAGGGPADSKKLVLGGTYSYIADGTSEKPYGYNEINVSSDELNQWGLNTARNSYLFANSANYASAKLSLASINNLAVLEFNGEKRLFASTSSYGLWSASLDSTRPDWQEE